MAYDHDVFLWPDLTGESIVDFRLGVPADTVVYLWAFADEDMDEVINESGERVASGGSDGEGTYVTGSSDSQQHLPLAGDVAGSRCFLSHRFLLHLNLRTPRALRSR